MRIALGLGLAVVAACGGPRGRSPIAPPPGTGSPTTEAAVALPPAPPALAPAPTGLRLPAGARPRGYQLALDVDPRRDHFTGRIAIEVELDQPTHPLWLNADELAIETAQVRGPGDAVTPLRVVPGGDGVIGLAGDAPLGPGVITVELIYRGVTAADRQGLELREDQGERYLVSELETSFARRIAPCFDEPAFKVPWQVELTVPAGELAAGNAPIASEQPLPDGRRVVRFAPTAPIPSYLFAIAVGPFEAVDAGTTRGGVPMRLLVPRGHAAEAAFMARQSGPLVAALEDYTGQPFPFAKLDHVVVPGQSGGAMENVGLITYAPRYLLIDERESDDVRRVGVATMAHELAHQWFGNLVTLTWWDDTWLNEGFASWAGNKLMEERYPALGGTVDGPQSRRDALVAEADPTARAIRQPVVVARDLVESFDAIAYDKAAGVLAMFEQAIGPDNFRAGVRAYLHDHAGGNATAADFVAALSTAAGRDLQAPLAAWLDRPGAPVIGMNLACPRGQPAVLELSQHRYAPAGTTPDPLLWPVPLCVRIPDEATPRCTTLTDATGGLELGPTCPDAVVAIGRGHYRSAPSPALRAALRKAWRRLAPAEQTAFVDDTVALVDAGEVPLDELLALLPLAGAGDNPVTALAAAGAIRHFDGMVADADRPAFAKLVRRSIGALARRAGWLPRPGEPLVESLVRRSVPGEAARAGRDPVLGRAARKLAMRWLDDHRAIPTAQWTLVLAAAVRFDPDGALFERLLVALTDDPDIAARRAIAGAVRELMEPARITRVLARVAALPAVPGELALVFFSPDRSPAVTPRLAFWQAHGAELLAKVPLDWRANLAPYTCLADQRAAVAAILDALFVPMPTFGAAARDRQLAAMDSCRAANAAQAGPLHAWLAAHR